MSSVRLPSSMPSLEDGISIGPESLSQTKAIVKKRKIKGNMSGKVIGWH